MPILVTGAAGFAGSYVVEALAGSGDTIGWTHRSSPPGEVAPLAAWERVDLLNPAEVRDAIARIRPSAVIHCAGAPNVAHSWRDTLTPLSFRAKRWLPSLSGPACTCFRMKSISTSSNLQKESKLERRWASKQAKSIFSLQLIPKLQSSVFL